MKFNLKLHQCCDHGNKRMATQHIIFKNNKIVVTNGYILMVVDMGDLMLLKKDIAILDGKSMHWKGFRKIWNKEVAITEGGMECNSERFFVPWSKEEFPFVKWEKVVPTLKNINPVKSISINATLLNKLAYCFPNNGGIKGMFDLYFDDGSKTIVVFSDPLRYKSFALIKQLSNDKSFIPSLDKEKMNFLQTKKGL